MDMITIYGHNYYNGHLSPRLSFLRFVPRQLNVFQFDLRRELGGRVGPQGLRRVIIDPFLDPLSFRIRPEPTVGGVWSLVRTAVHGGRRGSHKGSAGARDGGQRLGEGAGAGGLGPAGRHLGHMTRLGHVQRLSLNLELFLGVPASLCFVRAAK